MNTTTHQTLHRQLIREGFQPGPPPSLCRDAQRIDREVCKEASCDDCSQQGLEYQPFHCGREYRALAVCPACGEAFEF
jgi:hypothetical protein